jgi:hypothetical protein
MPCMKHMCRSYVHCVGHLGTTGQQYLSTCVGHCAEAFNTASATRLCKSTKVDGTAPTTQLANPNGEHRAAHQLTHASGAAFIAYPISAASDTCRKILSCISDALGPHSMKSNRPTYPHATPDGPVLQNNTISGKPLLLRRY